MTEKVVTRPGDAPGTVLEGKYARRPGGWRLVGWRLVGWRKKNAPWVPVHGRQKAPVMGFPAALEE